MGWWIETSKQNELVIGDEPLDYVAQMLDQLVHAYQTEWNRNPSLYELERSLEIVLSAQVDKLIDTTDDMELASVSMKMKKRPKKQRIRIGDFFSVPLPSGGYGFGRVRGVYLTSILLVDFLSVYSEQHLGMAELSKCSVLYQALVGYLGLADWHWKIIGNVPIPKIESSKSEAQQLKELISRFVDILAPLGDAPIRLEEALRGKGRLRAR